MLVTYATADWSTTGAASSGYALAHMWFNLAAVQGEENAQKAREIVVESMTPDQIAEAERMTREWMANHQQ